MQTSTFEQNLAPLALAAGVALLALVAVMLYVKRGEIAAALNPVSPDNLAYQGANAVGSVLTGTPAGEFTLGGWIYDLLNPNAPRADAPVVLDVPGGQGASGSW